MKWTIDKSRLPAFVRVDTSGEAGVSDLKTMWQEIIEGDFWEPGFPILVDNRNLKEIKDPDKFTRAAIDFFAGNTQRVGASCIAVLSSQPDNYKYARQFQYGIRLKGSDAVLQIFSSETQALDWLEHFCQIRDEVSQTADAST